MCTCLLSFLTSPSNFLLKYYCMLYMICGSNSVNKEGLVSKKNKNIINIGVMTCDVHVMLIATINYIARFLPLTLSRFLSYQKFLY